MLARLSADIEERFLACGRALQDQVQLTTRLSAQSRRLIEFADRSATAEDSALQRVSQVMTTRLTLGAQLADEVERLAETLERYAQHLQHLLGDQQQLERSFAPMRVLHSFFRIESAALPPEQQALFGAVTAEMQRLHGDVTASFAEHAATLEGTRQRVLAAAADLHALACRLDEVTRRKRADADRALARLHEELGRSRERNRQLESAIRSLDRATDAITVGLQYQDITRQKMEHVQAAARTLLEQWEHPDDTPFPRRTRIQQVLCEVQRAQLEAVQLELEQATTSISTGLRTLLDQLQRIEQECLSLASLNEITAGMDAALAEMQDIRRVTAELMHSSLASLSHAIQVAHGFARATTGATDTMRQLAADLLLVGLNAQVQALQAKNGCLEVLSSAVSQISSEAGTLTLQFETKLADTTETLTSFVHSSQAFHDQTAAQHRDLDATHEAVLHDFAAEHQSSQALVAEVASLLRQLGAQTDDLLSSVDLAEVSREPINDAREIFVALGALLARASSEAPVGDDAVLAEMQSRYTMDSERAAHAGVLAGAVTAVAVGAVAAGTTAEPVPQPAAAGDSSVLGDNVELF